MAADLDMQETLSLAHIEPYTARFDYYLAAEDGTSEHAGHWTDSLEVSKGQVIRRVERFNLSNQVDLARAVVADQDTLAPVRVQQRFGPQLSNLYQIEFRGRQLTQVLIGNAETPARIASAELSQSVVETGLHAVFVLALPFGINSQSTVTTYEAGAEPKTIAKTFHVVGQETVDVMGQELKAWRIEDRESEWTYWVRREKPYIVKVSHPMPSGKMATSVVTQFD